MSKLIRDKIPDRMRAEGLTPTITVDQGLGPLLAKLREEVAELEAAVLLGSRAEQAEEMADVQDVVMMIGYRLRIQPLDLKLVADAKQKRSGLFGEGYILHETPTPLRRMVYYPGVAADVARLRALLHARGFEVAEGDVALAYNQYSEIEYAVGWLDLDDEMVRKGEAYIVASLVVHLEKRS